MTNYEPDMNRRIWQVVALIPRGRVSTYGHVAEKAGLAGAARRVGSALRALPADSKIPWHRVLNSKGDIALPTTSGSHQIQRDRLEAEGVLFSTTGRVDLEHFGW